MMDHLRIGTTDSVTYRPRRRLRWSLVRMACWIFVSPLLGASGFGLVLIGGVAPIGMAMRIVLIGGGLVCLTLVFLGIRAEVQAWFRQWRGTNCMTVTADGIRLGVTFGPSLLGAQSAEWSSLNAFVVTQPPVGRARRCAKARIVGPGVSRRLRGKSTFVILDMFPKPIAEIVDELNALRPRSPANDAAAAIPAGAEQHAALPSRPSPVLALMLLGFFAFRLVCDWHDLFLAVHRAAGHS
jgi:hypothetical protein